MPEFTTPLDWNARLVRWFLRNTQLVVIVFICLVVGGIYSFLNLRTEGFPSPDVNIAIITDAYQGASAVEVESQILKPLEADIQNVRGVGDVSSTASSGFGLLSVTFEAGTDFKSALAELRSKVQSTKLPVDAEKIQISIPDIGGNVSYYAVTQPKVAAATLRVAGETVRNEVESIDGVKQFKLVSDITDQIEIHWRIADLAAKGITPLQIQQALASNNITIPAGTVSLGSNTANVLTVSSITSIADIKALVFGSTGLQVKEPVKLSDVADIIQVAKTKDLTQTVGIRDNTRLISQPALIYALSLKSTADIIKTGDRIKSALIKFSDGSSLGGAKVITVFSAADQVASQVKEITNGAVGGLIGKGPLAQFGYLLGGVWLVILVMLIFVNWRAALISGLVIPLSLLFTFLALKLMGITLNTLTLFSMILVLGLVVDPAIVVLEAIQRELDLGLRGLAAILAAISSVGNGVFMAVLTSVIVFLPFAVVSGVFGQIIRYIPLTVIPALLASYFIPLLFLTYFAQRYLRPVRVTAHSEDEVLWSTGRWFIRANRYILQHKWIQIAVIALAITVPLGVAGSLFITKKVVPVQFSAAPDVDRLQLSVSFPSNLTDVARQKFLMPIDATLAQEKSLASYFPQAQSGNSIVYILNLLPRSEREVNSPAIVTRLQDSFNQFNDPAKRVFYRIASEDIGPPIGDFPVKVNIHGDNLKALKAAAIKTGDILRARPEVTRVEDGFTGIDNPEVQITLDRPKLQAFGLSSIQVAQTLATLVGRTPVTKFNTTLDGAERSDEVILVAATLPNSLEAISNLVIVTTPAGPLLVRDIASVTEDQAFTGISRLNGSRYITVQAQVKDAINDAAAPQKAVSEYWTPSRLVAAGLRENALEDKGSGNEFIQSFKDLFMALGVAILLTYIVLILFFRSFTQPFIILFAVPLSFIGVFPALAAIGGQFGFLEILGIITLVGIVENVGIFVIDLANRKRAEGIEYREAISQATGVRFRPIFLTKVTALGGLLPLIILSPFWRSLALVVVSGILTSGILSLFTTPILYSWLIEFGGWTHRLTHRKAEPSVMESPSTS